MFANLKGYKQATDSTETRNISMEDTNEDAANKSSQSSFNIFRDSIKDQVQEIHNQTRMQLPSVLDEGEDESSLDGESIDGEKVLDYTEETCGLEKYKHNMQSGAA